MLSHIDERKGLVKVTWSDIRKRVYSVEPDFAKLVDDISPNQSYPLFLAYYPYGQLKGDTVSTFLPMADGGQYRIIDPSAPKDVTTHLMYGSGSSPFGLLLEKKLEYFIDLKELGISIPWQVSSPGSFFPLSRMLQSQPSRIYTPNGLLSAVSGARSVFMLPKIGCATNHLTLRRSYNVQPQPPKSLYDHWSLFKEITHNNHDDDAWRSCVLYFSKKWVDKINNDKAWHPIKKYLLELAWKKYDFDRNRVYYNIFYSLTQHKRNLKPNPYLVDTACHIFTVALGEAPGYAPACDNESLPLDKLQNAFVESYGLKKYIPTIMQPEHFIFESKKSKPVYYSLQMPSTYSFSPKSRKLSSTISEISELHHIVNIFKTEMSAKKSIISDTALSTASNEVEFNFYHNQQDQHKTINDSESIILHDSRFSAKHAKHVHPEATFASDAPFVRGCVSIGFAN